MTRYIDAFLDDELSVIENLRLQAHLAFCGNCKAIVKSEVRLRSLIEADALEDTAPDHLRERILRDINEQPQAKSSPGLGRLTPPGGFFAGLLAGAVAVGCILSLALYLLKSAPGKVPLPVAEMVGKHQMYSRGEASLQVRNSDQSGVGSWLRQQLAFPVRLPVLAGPGDRLVGARISSIADRRAAYVLYEMAGRRISLYVFADPPGDFSSGSRKLVAGTEFFSSSFEGVPVVWWENQELYYSAVADTSVNDLLEFGLLCVKAERM